MKTLILDTHTLVWFLQKDKRLPKSSLKAILKEANHKVVPLIVLFEIQYLNFKGRFQLSAKDLSYKLNLTKNFSIASHDEKHIEFINQELDIHDALIVSVACEYKIRNKKDVFIISKDKDITKYSKIPVIWK